MYSARGGKILRFVCQFSQSFVIPSSRISTVINTPLFWVLSAFSFVIYYYVAQCSRRAIANNSISPLTMNPYNFEFSNIATKQCVLIFVNCCIFVTFCAQTFKMLFLDIVIYFSNPLICYLYLQHWIFTLINTVKHNTKNAGCISALNGYT